MVYEGEQEGPFQVAYNLVEKAIRTLFVNYFPNPEVFKKKKNKDVQKEENPYKPIIKWFDQGNNLNIFLETKDADKILLLYTVDGLYALVKKMYGSSSEMEMALLMEFLLHGLASYSLISKKVLDSKIEFKDLMGSMLNMGSQHFNEDDLNDEDFT